MRKWWENKQTMQTMKKQLFLALKANNHTALLLLKKNKKIKQEKKGFRTEHSFFFCLYGVCFMFGFCLMRWCKCMFLWFVCYFRYTRKKIFSMVFFSFSSFLIPLKLDVSIPVQTQFHKYTFNLTTQMMLLLVFFNDCGRILTIFSHRPSCFLQSANNFAHGFKCKYFRSSNFFSVYYVCAEYFLDRYT